MTLAELRYNVITAALKKHKGNAKKAAKEVGVSGKTIFTFKAEQKRLNKLKQ